MVRSSFFIVQRIDLQFGPDTISHNVSSSSGWSKEAIFTLLSVFLTVLLAVIGLTFRYYMRKDALGYRSSRQCRRVEGGKQYDGSFLFDTY